MRFRFCGDLDCPDWVLAEINTLSRMTSIKMKLLCNLVMSSLMGQDIDYDKAKKLTLDAKFDDNELKGCIAALGFILKSSSRYNTDTASLDSELQQLGLPRELALAVSRCHNDNTQELSKRLQSESLRLSKLCNIECNNDEVTVAGEYKIPVTTVNIEYENFKSEKCFVNFAMSCSQLDTLISELKIAKEKMVELEKSTE